MCPYDGWACSIEVYREILAKVLLHTKQPHMCSLNEGESNYCVHEGNCIDSICPIEN
jgi:hypothetical protein